MSKKRLVRNYLVKMSDESVWAVPISQIAMNRAEYLTQIDGVDIETAFKDVMREFEADLTSVGDWAQNNMNWSEVAQYATMLHPPKSSQRYSNDWCNPLQSMCQ